MSDPVLLCDYAHARAGDKGNILSVAVFAYDPAHYAWLASELTCLLYTSPSPRD